MVRSNPASDNQWTILANPLQASPLTNRTAFLDIGAATRPHPGHTNSDARDLYCVLLIPDFWVSPQGATLDGGPEHCGADFIPIYTGSPETDPSQRPFWLHVEMVLDSDRATEEESSISGTPLTRASNVSTSADPPNRSGLTPPASGCGTTCSPTAPTRCNCEHYSPSTYSLGREHNSSP